MLVITRKANEQVAAIVSPQAIAELAAAGLGLEMTIHVLASNGRRSRLGLDAPAAVRFVRGKLTRRKEPTNDETRNDASAGGDAPDA